MKIHSKKSDVFQRREKSLSRFRKKKNCIRDINFGFWDNGGSRLMKAESN